MAKKMCDLCQKNYASVMRYGVNLCDPCSDEYDQAIFGDAAAAEKFSNPENFPDATPLAIKNIVGFVAKRNGRPYVTSKITKELPKAAQTHTSPKITDAKSTRSTLEEMYANIGSKIKGWAKWIFIVGAIAAVLCALEMLFSAEDGAMLMEAIIILVAGPLIAWVSSWVLYGFGELIEKTTANEKNTKEMLEIMKQNKP